MSTRFALAAVVAAGILAFYAARLAMPLPIFASDEAAYLIRALYAPDVVARNAVVADVTNGVHLSIIRALFALPAPLIVSDRLVDAAAYLGGLVLLWRTATAGQPRRQQAALLLLVVGFPYYRFAFSNLAEGPYVGVLALACVLTSLWWRTRPLAHALAAGVLLAALVLIKPHGVAVVAAGALVAGLDAWASGQWRGLACRALVAVPTFFLVGNAIQVASDSPPANPLTFFMSPFYTNVLSAGPPSGRVAMGLLELLATTSGAAILMGFPIAAGLIELYRRRLASGPRFVMAGRDIAFLLLVGSLLATLAMVAVFASRAAVQDSEARRLWGRYFEFFTPLIWLAVSPSLLALPSRRAAIACAAAPLVGLVGLMVSFRCGVVLFPWDSTILTAFFAPDPVRAPLGVALPYRALAASAVALAAAGFAFRRRPAEVGLALVLALGVLSTWLDHAWLGPMIRTRYALEADIRAIQPRVPPTARLTLLARDANEAELVFLRFHARPDVLIGPPDRAAPVMLSDADELLVNGPAAPPGGPWLGLYRGEQLSLFARPPT